MSKRTANSRSKSADKSSGGEETPETSGFPTIPASSTYSLPSNDVLKLFQDSFRYLLNSPNLESFIQTVKGDLYERDYIKAFGDDDRRMAYVVRWTPSRALCYSSLFSSLEEIRNIITERDSRILCIGGGACGELVGLSAVFAQSRDFYNKERYRSKLDVKLIDIADWGLIADKLTSEIKKCWLYNEPDYLNVEFLNEDVLNANHDSSLQLNSLDLITLLFTTNELFSEDKAKSIRFFQALDNCQPGAHLLIAESAGSYSHITVGTKKFPIQFLIDTILLGKDGSGNWELVKQSDSCWYRCEKDYDYPLKVENMRFFFRLYKRK